MKWFYLLLYLTCLTSAIKAQNLVLNPSFEDFYTCPSSISDLGLCKSWSTPNLATTDYFNSCANDLSSSIPFNAFGQQKPYSGNAYIGIITYQENLSSNQFFDWYTEISQGVLKKTLEKDQYYKVSFYVSAGEISKYFHHLIGVAFTKDSLSLESHTLDGIDEEMKLFNMNIQIIEDNKKWVLVKGLYKAKGTEKYILIGNVYEHVQDSFLIENKARSKDKTLDVSDQYAYCFIDEVLVEKANSAYDTIFERNEFISRDEFEIGRKIRLAKCKFFFKENTDKIYTNFFLKSKLIKRQRELQKSMRIGKIDHTIFSKYTIIDSINAELANLNTLKFILSNNNNIKIEIKIVDSSLSSKSYTNRLNAIRKEIKKMRIRNEQVIYSPYSPEREKFDTEPTIIATILENNLPVN